MSCETHEVIGLWDSSSYPFQAILEGRVKCQRSGRVAGSVGSGEVPAVGSGRVSQVCRVGMRSQGKGVAFFRAEALSLRFLRELVQLCA